MPLINEERLEGRLLEISKGRIVLLTAAAAGIGLLLGVMLF